MGWKYCFSRLVVMVSLAILGVGVYLLAVPPAPGRWGLSYADELSKNIVKTYHDFSGCQEERAALEGFTNQYFIHDGFVRTNLIETKQGELASGADFLSESAGLLMLYYLCRDERQKFDGEVHILMTHFLNENQLIKWRIRRGQNRETVNSTIDDLRIVKALMMAAKKWNRNDYHAIAGKLSAQLLKHCVSEKLLKAYDSPNSPQAPLVYYDLIAMQRMGEFDNEWRELAAVNMEIIKSHQVKGLPLYQDDWFSKGKTFPTVENLMTMMHLSEVGIKDPQSITWLKYQLRRKGLFGRYSVEGTPLNSVESPAIYAVTAIIARLNNDKELYSLAAERLKKMQNMKNNEYYGGFIDLNRRSAFSFDQLLSLLAY